MSTRSTRMRLVHVTTVPQTLGFLSGQMGYMRDQGFDVHAVSSPGAELARFGLREQVQVHGAPKARRIAPSSDIVSLSRLFRVIRDLQPHIVHAHTAKAGFLSMIAARAAGVPVAIYHLHGLRHATELGCRRAVLVLCEKMACRLADSVLCVSFSTKRAAIGDRICARRKIRVLGSGSISGIDARVRFNPDTCDPGERRRVRDAHGIPMTARVIGYVGRIVSDKGLSDLTSAWSRLSRNYPDVHLMVVGSFEPEDPLPDEVERALRSDERIHLAGQVPDTIPFYSAMDVVVLPSHREGFGMVLLEAAAMGLPTVATRIAGCVDAVADGVTGTLAPPHDPSALAQAIRAYLDSPGLRKLHGTAGRERALQDFRQEELWQATHAEYVRLLARAGISPPLRAFIA